MSRAKLHHFNPRSVLRNFSIEGERQQVWVFDKRTGNAHREGISTAGGEKHFNQVVIGGKGIDFEGAFDDVDGALPLLLGQIIEHEQVASLNEAGRDTLALLATIQFLRVKIIRDTAQAIPDQLRKSLEDAGLAELAAAIPKGADNDGRKAGLALLRKAEKMASHFRSKELTLYKAPDGSSFWTSDCPVVMANHFPGGDLGLGARGVEVCWPISSGFLISFRCPSIRKKMEEDNQEVAHFLAAEPTLLCRPGDVEWFNTLQVNRSTRFLYADNEDFIVAERLLGGNAGQDPPVLFSIGRMGAAPERSAMPPGITLIASGRETEHRCPVESWTRESGRWHLVITRNARRAAEHLLTDGPFQMAEIYDATGPGSAMREVTIEKTGDDPIRLLVEHRDPGLRNLMRQIDERT